ncbi:hypothetical protein HaLaN_06771, partial [Haematococcus lacustris]
RPGSFDVRFVSIDAPMGQEQTLRIAFSMGAAGATRRPISPLWFVRGHMWQYASKNSNGLR